MKSILVFLAALSMMLSACSERQPDEATFSYVDSLMNASFKANAPGGVVLVAKNGVPIFRKAYGLANWELGVPMKPEHVFAIASMTKQFSAVCMLQLVQRGKVSLQDDIRKYLPGYNTHGRVITIEHLLTHTSGIPNIFLRPGHESIAEPSDEELIQCTMNDPLNFEPGTDFAYNDLGFTLAAFVIEKASGMKYRDFVKENIFQPLGMNSTTIGTRERAIPMLANGYSSAGDTLFRPSEYFNWKWDYGMGDIVTCVDDMLKWDEALYTEKLVRRDLLTKAWTSYVLKDGRRAAYGYGWFVAEYEGVKFIHHSGGKPGFRSLSVRLPANHVFVVVLSNNGATGAAASIGAQIAYRLSGVTVPPRPRKRLPVEQLSEFEGVYRTTHSAISILTDMTQEKVYRTLTVKDTLLYLSRPGARKVAVFNVGQDLFTSGGNTFYHFSRDKSGKVTSFDIYTEPLEWNPRRIEIKTDLPIPKEKKPIAVDGKVLKTYAGKYVFGGDRFTKIRVNGSHIYSQEMGEIFAETETKFFPKNMDVTIEFTKNPKGAIAGLIVHGLGKRVAKKVE
jgi:CubicO group peptidase (beta-lactamase class C family)